MTLLEWLRIRPPPPKGPLWDGSYTSFPVSSAAVFQTPLAAPDLQAAPGSSFISLIHPPPPALILPVCCQAERLAISAALRGDQVCKGWGLAPPWGLGRIKQLLFPSPTWQHEPPFLKHWSREMHSWERTYRICLDSEQPEAQDALLEGVGKGKIDRFWVRMPHSAQT